MTSTLRPTPGQTVGPFYGFALPYPGDSELVKPATAGGIRLHGTVYDGTGGPLIDSLVEIRQAAADGTIPRVDSSLRRNGVTFTGWGRCGTDGGGNFGFWTLRPGRMGAGAPFFAVTVFARGLLHRLCTRAYLPGTDISTEPFLATLPPERARTLVARDDPDGIRFDIHLQASDDAVETVFLEYPGEEAGR